MEEAVEIEAFIEFMRIELQNDNDKDFMKCATSDIAEDEAKYAAFRRDYVNMLRCRRRKVEL